MYIACLYQVPLDSIDTLSAGGRACRTGTEVDHGGAAEFCAQGFLCFFPVQKYGPPLCICQHAPMLLEKVGKATVILVVRQQYIVACGRRGIELQVHSHR